LCRPCYYFAIFPWFYRQELFYAANPNQAIDLLENFIRALQSIMQSGLLLFASGKSVASQQSKTKDREDYGHPSAIAHR
jgi:hypothetical protein